MRLKKYFFSLWKNSEEELRNNIFRLLEENSGAIFLDCGCDKGDFTIEIANRIKARKIYGIDITKERYIKAEEKGIIVKNSNLNDPFPFENESIDVLHTNQVIEHLWNLDNFVRESYRVLRPNGYAIISTENLASWHNIFSLLLGLQPFSLTNISQLKSIGNPFALHLADKKGVGKRYLKSFAHLMVPAYQGLKELFEAHHFTVERMIGAGYYPFSKYLSKILSKMDKRHTAFLTIKVRKKE